MFFIYQITKKILKLFKVIGSKESPTKVSLGMVVGVYWGLIPITQPVHWLLFLVLLTFKMSMRGALLMAFPMFLLSYPLSPLTDLIGKAVLTSDAFRGLFTGLYNSYFVLTNFNNTYVMGSLVMATAAAVPLFFILKSLIEKYREKIQNRFINTKIYKKFLSKIWFVRDIITGEQEVKELKVEEIVEEPVEKKPKTTKAVKPPAKKSTRNTPLSMNKNNTPETVKKNTSINIIEKKKSKIPFELKTFIPIASVVLIIFLGMKFYFDPTLKAVLESQATSFNKEPVRINSLTTSFSEAYLKFNGLEWVDQSDPSKILFQLQDFMGDIYLFPILQKRLVAEKVEVLGMDFNTDNPNYDPPPVVESSASTDTASTTTAKQEAANSESTSLNSENSGNEDKSLNDYVPDSVKNQVDKEVTGIANAVKEDISLEQAQVEKEIAEMEARYQTRIAEITKNVNFDQEISEVKKINFANINSIQGANEALQKIQKLDSGRKKMVGIKNQLKKLESDFKKDQKLILVKAERIKNIEEEGKKKLLKSLKLESFSAENVFERILGDKIVENLLSSIDIYRKYKHLIPTGDDEEDEVVSAGWRDGEYIHFQNQNNYPTFLLEEMLLTGNPEKTGLIKGHLKNVSSDLSYKPMETDLSIRKDDIVLHLDGTVFKDQAGINLDQKISTDPFPLDNLIKIAANPFIESITKGDATISGSLYDKAKDKSFEVKLNLVAENVGFGINSSVNPLVRKTLEKGLSRIERLTATIVYRVNDGKTRFFISSNLDKILEKSMKDYFDNLLKDQQKEIIKLYEKELANLDKTWLKKAGIDKSLEGSSEYLKKIDSYESAVKQAEKAGKDVKKREEDKLKKQAQEAATKEATKAANKAINKIKKLF